MIVLQAGSLVRRMRALCQAALVLAVLSYGGAVRVARAQTVSAICAARGPDMRTMPTPPLPGGVAIATMVSAAVLMLKCS